MKKYFVILLVVVVMFASQIACSDTGDYRGGFGDGLGIAGTLNDLTSR